MADDAFSFYCKKNYWERCDSANLIVVKILIEEFDDAGECRTREIIYKCAVCGGFYKQKYQATYSEGGWMGDEKGWVIQDRYFKIEQPYYEGVGSSGKPALPLDQARAYGYTGADFTWKNNRCNFNLQDVERTCRGIDLQFVAYRSPESKTHISDKFYKCRRCGQWYLFKIFQPYKKALLKPSNEHFPVEEARKFGYDETKFVPKTQEKSLAALFIEDSEGLPPPDEWLKERRSEDEQAEYAYFILEKHFIRANLKVQRYLDGLYGWSIFPAFLISNIGKFAEAGEHTTMLKNLLAELTLFYEAATGKSFAEYLFIRLRSFIDRDASYRRIEPFLPVKAFEKPDEMQKISDRQCE